MKLFPILALQGTQACLNLNKCENPSSGNLLGSSGSSGSSDSSDSSGSSDSGSSGFRSDCIAALTSYDHAHPEEGIFSLFKALRCDRKF